MKNEKSYAELMKTTAMNKRQKEILLQELIIDMVLHESLLKNRKAKLEHAIDAALDLKNKNLFLKLSSEMIELHKSFGT